MTLSPIAAPEAITLRRFDLFRCLLSPALLLVAAGMLRAATDPDLTQGWQPQTFASVHAITNARIVHGPAHSGDASLAVTVHLDGATRTRREGEVFVDLRYYGPDDQSNPIDLAGKSVTAWVLAPAGLKGPAPSPTGLRLFVKDSHWRSEYGPWTPVQPGRWMRVSLVPSAGTPAKGSRDAGFDPQHVVLLGLSVAAGRGSTVRFEGDINLDDVAWNGHTQYGFE